MNCLLTEREIFLAGVGAFIFILLSLWMNYGEPKRSDLPEGFTRAGLAFQLVGTAPGVKQVLGSSPNDYRPILRRSIQKDFVYIAGYVILFLFLGILITQAGTSATRWVGLLAAISIIAAAVFDLTENFGMLRTISLNPNHITVAMAIGIRRASLFKWGFFFSTMFILGLSLLPRLGFLSIIGALLLVSAVVGFVGLRWHQLIPMSIPPLALALVAIAFSFVIWPTDILRKLCSGE